MINQVNLNGFGVEINIPSIQEGEVGETPTTRIVEEELKKEIIKETEEYRKATSREDKKEIMVKRRNDNLSYIKKNLDLIYPRVLENLENINKLDFEKFEPEIIFCEEKKDKELWTFFRNTVSSLVNTGYYGRNIKFLLRDKHSGCFIGIVGLGSDFMSLGAREEYIGWNKRDKFGITIDKFGKEYTENTKSWVNMKRLGLEKRDNKINNLLNIFVCVSLFPFNELITGKLLTMSCFSNEVLEEMEKRYSQKLAGITTTSIYGKSIQYDKIPKYLKFIGMSKGVGTVQFSKTLIEKIREYYINNREKNGWEKTSELGLQPKARMILTVCKQLGFSSKILNHSHQRGIYFGFTHQNSKLFLNGKIGEEELKRIEGRKMEEIVKEWKERWLVKRKERFEGIRDRKDEIIKYYNPERF